MTSSEIRDLFVRFFAERGHRHVPSSSLIPPPEEKTLLFTNAGMNQMKPFFMGMAEPPAPRMTSIQKCFRTSDIEAVGDASHCTFFEMLGNFSVGDYFKPEIIAWAFELLTAAPPNGLGLRKDRIWTTVYLDDDESFDLWRQQGIPAERIVRFDETENYWFMIKGGAGPCGPNTEIYYDYGPEQGCGEPGCSPPTHDCGRFIELWNLVFMTLFQDEDGSRRPLPQVNVDTGGGLERWPGPVMWERGIDWRGNPHEWKEPPTIFDTGLFQPILAGLETLTNVRYESATEAQRRAMRIVAEHSRAATFLISDGVMPSNEGRGYILRRLIRRAIYYAFGIFPIQGLLERAGVYIGGVMNQQYPELVANAGVISQVMRDETERFSRTLNHGRSALGSLTEYADLIRRHFRTVAKDPMWRQYRASQEDFLGGLMSSNSLPEPLKEAFVEQYEQLLGKQWWLNTSAKLEEAAELTPKLTGKTAFVLWDTFGFPMELTKEVATEHGFEVDFTEFERLMEEQRQRSRAATRFEGDSARIQTYGELGLDRTEFLGYETTRAFASVVAIVLDGTEPVQSLTAEAATGHRVEVVLSQTPFYAEGGGQVGDRGEIGWAGAESNGQPRGRFVVEDTQAVGEGGVSTHVGRLESGILSVGAAVEARVDEGLRGDTMRNHTATHILHAALRQTLGSHVRQAGSLVTPDRLRFDFTHLEALSPDEIRQVESLANKVVRENLPVHVDYKRYEDALADGALAFFGDKYAAEVRVVGVCYPEQVEIEPGERCFSHELCGGTHVHASGDVGTIIVTAETSIGAGLRRIEAVSGRAAAERLRQHEEVVAGLSLMLKAPPGELGSRIEALQEENDRLRKQLQAAERRAARDASQAVDATMIGETAVIVHRIDASSGDAMREAGDALKSRYQSAVLLLAAAIDGKPAFLAMVTPDVARKVSAGEIVKLAAGVAGGGGGGRPEVAQGGGTDVSKIEAALAAGRKLIEEKLQAP
ncbi:MAG: alanine--tRNA ligase [Dehalococcoidia bacterium]|nr:alanine--tRNA ligase [Dehalococcoidia bacterium]